MLKTETPTFEFKVSKPETGPSSKYDKQYISAYAKYPNFVYAINLRPFEIDTKEQIEIAIDKIKIKLIQEIVNAKFRYE